MVGTIAELFTEFVVGKSEADQASSPDQVVSAASSNGSSTGVR
jgi:hypothetical protein